MQFRIFRTRDARTERSAQIAGIDIIDTGDITEGLDTNANSGAPTNRDYIPGRFDVHLMWFGLSILIVAYLLNGIFTPLSAGEEIDGVDIAEIAQSIEVIDADFAYGEYLAAECLTCHQAQESSNASVPTIHGEIALEIITALLEYKNKVRKNTTMISIATSLSDEDIASLAKYFSRTNN